MPTSEAVLTPVITRIPTVQDHLESAFLHSPSSYYQEGVEAEYLRIRREALSKVDETLTESDALFDVRNFLSTDEVRRKASQDLALDSQSPIVSKQTQVAFLKQLMQDFLRGKKRAGLSALTALKASEMLNRMLAYDAPVKQEVAVNHTVTCLPVIQAPFRGELPILKVIDIGDEQGRITSVATGDKVEPTDVSPETNSDLQLF